MSLPATPSAPPSRTPLSCCPCGQCGPGLPAPSCVRAAAGGGLRGCGLTTCPCPVNTSLLPVRWGWSSQAGSENRPASTTIQPWAQPCLEFALLSRPCPARPVQRMQAFLFRGGAWRQVFTCAVASAWKTSTKCHLVFSYSEKCEVWYSARLKF